VTDEEVLLDTLARFNLSREKSATTFTDWATSMEGSVKADEKVVQKSISSMDSPI
jgi:hypothetical protein